MQLNNHFGHDIIIVMGLEYFAIFNFCDFYRPAKIKYPLYGMQNQRYTFVIAVS